MVRIKKKNKKREKSHKEREAPHPKNICCNISLHIVPFLYQICYYEFKEDKFMRDVYTEIRREFRRMNYDLYIETSYINNEPVYKLLIFNLLKPDLFTERLYSDIDFMLRDAEDWITNKRQRLLNRIYTNKNLGTNISFPSKQNKPLVA